MTQNQNLLQVGEIIGFHGLDGEVKIRPYTDSPDNFYNFESVIIRDKELGVRECRVHAGKVYLYLERVTKRTTAEKILGEKVFVSRDQVEELEEDEFFIVDLIGAAIIDDKSNKKLGVLKDVKQTGVVDNFEIDLSKKTILVPALKEHFTIIDSKTIRANIPEEYFEL